MSALRVLFAGLIFLQMAWPGAGAAARADGAVRAALEADGRAFTIAAPGLTSFRAGFAATVEWDGQPRVLDSGAGTVVSHGESSTEATPYGAATVAGTVIRFEKEQLDLLFRLGRVPGEPGILLQAGIRNSGSAPLKLATLSPVFMEEAGGAPGSPALRRGLEPAGHPPDWQITGVESAMTEIVSLDEILTPLEVREAGGFYRRDGHGFFFGPVGVPTAYLRARLAPLPGGRTLFQLSAEMSGALVEAGETRWGQQVVLLPEPAPAAVARWAEWVGKTHGARTSKGALSGWNSWNFRTRKITEKELLDVAGTVQRSGGRLHPGVIQIDDSVEPGRRALDAPWLLPVAQRVRETGARFGVRLGFDRNMLPPAPGTPADLTDFNATVRRAVGSGCNYLKISCPPFAERAAGEKRTAFEIYRDEWAAIRQAAGEDAYLLASGGPVDRALVGRVDACRTGPNATRLGLRAAMLGVPGAFPLNGRWFAVDHDVYYMAGEIEGMCSVGGGWPVMQTWLSMTGLSCGAAITSEPFYWREFKHYWRNMEVLTPPAVERTKVLGWGSGVVWPALVGHVRRAWGDSTVVLLVNFHASKVEPFRLDLADAGLDPKRRYAVWSFWENQFLGVAKGSWTSPVLAKGASEHLCLTDLDRTPDRPVLIGSNLHIYCGAAEIRHVTSSRDAMQIELTDAGARAGDLFIHSRWPPAFKASAGCSVSEVHKAGENVWRVSLADRQRGVPQRVELSILLPVTRQTWFWLLIATAAGSLLFAVWRSVVGLVVERAHLLDRERARIARDMHDEIGGQLARLSVVGELHAEDAGYAAEDRQWVREMARGIRRAASDLEQIIWSVNPVHDTLEGLAHRLFQHAEEFFSGTHIRCRFAALPVLPAVPTAPETRASVLRAFKEALTNVLKHAAATEVQIAVQVDALGMHIRVADNGCGFDAAQPGPAVGGSGLANMRQRMAKLGGDCQIESVPGRGTTVILNWPLKLPRRASPRLPR